MRNIKINEFLLWKILAYNGFVFACSSSVRVIEPIGDVSLPLVWSIRIFVFVTLLPRYLLPNLVFGKCRLFFFIFFYILYLHMYLLNINLHYLQYIYYNTIILVKLNYS